MLTNKAPANPRLAMNLFCLNNLSRSHHPGFQSQPAAIPPVAPNGDFTSPSPNCPSFDDSCFFPSVSISSLKLNSLLGTAFVHYVDTSSLALIVPNYVDRGLRERRVDIKRKANQIIGNLATLAKSKSCRVYTEKLPDGINNTSSPKAFEIQAVVCQNPGDTDLFYIQCLIHASVSALGFQSNHLLSNNLLLNSPTQSQLALRLLTSELKKLSRDPFTAHKFTDALNSGLTSGGHAKDALDLKTFINKIHLVGLCQLATLQRQSNKEYMKR
ncbi:hypothetical protein PCANC_06582 [Puccinia coronata f. sp. avenae]|uniref:Uncharacterized protein n=1 Tax=Puccinia coronata f. sp. avenae TaxID=200324 RepID=A0A2N5VA59_9BASI|nr:hypothetical protein PCANC_06582 [Puccinia coronata f. sp. avenae]